MIAFVVFAYTSIHVVAYRSSKRVQTLLHTKKVLRQIKPLEENDTVKFNIILPSFEPLKNLSRDAIQNPQLLNIGHSSLNTKRASTSYYRDVERNECSHISARRDFSPRSKTNESIDSNNSMMNMSKNNSPNNDYHTSGDNKNMISNQQKSADENLGKANSQTALTASGGALPSGTTSSFSSSSSTSTESGWIVALVLGSFFVCFLPLITDLMIQTCGGEVSKEFDTLCQFLSMSATFVNPLVFFVCDRRIRFHTLKLFRP